MRLAHAFAVLAVATSLSAIAAVPTTMSYQGYLTSGGVPVNTTVSMTLKLYDAPTDGNLIWSETQSVAVANGIYNVVLGNTNPLDENILAGPRYLTVAVGADADMAPRTPLASAPYAILAKALDGTVPVAKGGTGLNSVTTNGLLYGQGTGAVGVTGAGSVGQVLTATAGGVPQWSNSSGVAPLQISHPAWVVIQGVTFEAPGIGMGSGQSLSIGGAQVLGQRQAGVSNGGFATGIDVADPGPWQVATRTELNALTARFNALLDRLRNHGLIEASDAGDPNFLLVGAYVTPVSLVAGAVGYVNVEFITGNSWPADGKVQVTFPSGFNVSSVTVGSENLGGTLAASAAGQVVTITRSGGSIEPAGTPVLITLGSIANPGSSGMTSTFSIATQTSTGAPIDAGTAPGVVIVP